MAPMRTSRETESSKFLTSVVVVVFVFELFFAGFALFSTLAASLAMVSAATVGGGMVEVVVVVVSLNKASFRL